MKNRDYKRRYFRSQTLPAIAVCCAAAFGLWLVASGELWKLRPDSTGVLRVAPILVLLVWAAWGVRALRDRRPWLSTDRDGLTAHRQPDGPQTFAWEEIASVSLDVRMGTASAVLVLTMRGRGKRDRHAIPVGGLDADPGVICAHVLKCHAAARPLAEENEDEVDGAPDAPAEVPTEEPRPSGRPTRRLTFAPQSRFPLDPRWVSLALFVLGIIGAVATIDSEPTGRPMETGRAVVACASILACIVGLAGGVQALALYRLNARPPAGWPRLTVDSDGITFCAGPDDELEIPWERVRNVVWVRVTNTANVTATPGVIVYYLTRRGAVRQLDIFFAWWQDPDEMLQTLQEVLPSESA